MAEVQFTYFIYKIKVQFTFNISTVYVFYIAITALPDKHCVDAKYTSWQNSYMLIKTIRSFSYIGI